MTNRILLSLPFVFLLFKSSSRDRGQSSRGRSYGAYEEVDAAIFSEEDSRDSMTQIVTRHRRRRTESQGDDDNSSNNNANRSDSRSDRRRRNDSEGDDRARDERRTRRSGRGHMEEDEEEEEEQEGDGDRKRSTRKNSRDAARRLVYVLFYVFRCVIRISKTGPVRRSVCLFRFYENGKNLEA